MNSAQKSGIFGLIASSALASSALGVVPWSNPSGSTILFNYSGGEANNGLFGDPTITPNTFNFSPPNFMAGAGTGNTRTDTLTVMLTVNPGQVITEVHVKEVGTRNTTTGAFATGTLFVKDLQTGGFGQIQASLVTTYNGLNWTSEAVITGLNFTQGQSLSLSLTNNLLVTSSTKRIDKTGVTIEVTPAPGALALAGFAGLFMARRRR